jgi:hypothetical protein
MLVALRGTSVSGHMGKNGPTTHVAIVITLFGTVRIRLIDNPLYNAVQPSLTMIFLVVYTIPRRK